MSSEQGGGNLMVSLTIKSPFFTKSWLNHQSVYERSQVQIRLIIITKVTITVTTVRVITVTLLIRLLLLYKLLKIRLWLRFETLEMKSQKSF